MTTAWPFLITRNPHIDHRPVVVPHWMLAEAESLFAAAASDDAAESRVRVRRITGLSRSPIVVVSRTIVLRPEFIGLPVGSDVHDRAGRPIVWTEGVVLDGGSEPGLVGRSAIEKVHEYLVSLSPKLLSQFWPVEASIALPEAVTVGSLELELSAGPELEVVVQEPWQAPAVPPPRPWSPPTEDVPKRTAAQDRRDNHSARRLRLLAPLVLLGAAFLILLLRWLLGSQGR